MRIIAFLTLVYTLMFSGIAAQEDSINRQLIIQPVTPELQYKLITLSPIKYESVKELSQALTQSFTNDSEKVRSIFIYVTHAIDYDVAKLNYTRRNNDNSQTALQTLKKKKAICEGYANLFLELCTHANIKAVFIGGYSRNEGEQKAYPHAWNAAYINNQWKLFDATWGAGGLNAETNKFNRYYNDAYFMTAPNMLIQTHYPDDPMWQLLEQPLTRKMFNQKQTTATTTFFNYIDTIHSYFQTDSTTRSISELNRMLLYDPDNDAYQQQLNHVHENMEVDKMNDANDIANAGIKLLNNNAGIINDAKRKRNPAIMNNNEGVMMENIKKAKINFEKALALYKTCSPKLQENKNALSINIQNVRGNLKVIEENKKYLDYYFKTPKQNRARLL